MLTFRMVDRWVLVLYYSLYLPVFLKLQKRKGKGRKDTENPKELANNQGYNHCTPGQWWGSLPSPLRGVGKRTPSSGSLPEPYRVQLGLQAAVFNLREHLAVSAGVGRCQVALHLLQVAGCQKAIFKVKRIGQQQNHPAEESTRLTFTDQKGHRR